jgi:hypothetical protein
MTKALALVGAAILTLAAGPDPIGGVTLHRPRHRPLTGRPYAEVG